MTETGGRRGWLVAWALGAVAFGGASLVVPLYLVALGGSALTLGVLAAVAALVGVPGALVVGRLADRTGRRRPYVVGALAVAALTCALVAAADRLAAAVGGAEPVPIVVAANGVVWFAFAAAVPVVTLLAVEGAPEAAWPERIAGVNTFQGLGWAAGLLVGTVWTSVAGRWLSTVGALQGFLLLVAAVAAVGAALAWRTLPAEPREEPASGRRVRRAIRRSRSFGLRAVTFPFVPGRFDFRDLHPRTAARRFTPTLAAYFGAVGLFFAGFAAFFAPLPAFLDEAGFAPGWIFGLYLVTALVAAPCYGPAGELAARSDVGRVHALGLGLRGLALPVVAAAGGALGASLLGAAVQTLLFAVVGGTWALIAVTAGTLVARLAPEGVRGEALGVYAALGALAGGVGSLLGGWLAADGYLLAFGVAGALALASAGVVLALGRVGAPRESPGGVAAAGDTTAGDVPAEASGDAGSLSGSAPTGGATSGASGETED